GTLRTFETPVDLSELGDGFVRRALETVRTIPYGQMWTYGDVAAAAGAARGGRAAGSALARCPTVPPTREKVGSDDPATPPALDARAGDPGRLLLGWEARRQQDRHLVLRTDGQHVALRRGAPARRGRGRRE